MRLHINCKSPRYKVVLQHYYAFKTEFKKNYVQTV